MEMSPEQKRDFTQGEATRLLGFIKDQGAIFVKNVDEVINGVKENGENGDSH